jgi:hypothetical protein
LIHGPRSTPPDERRDELLADRALQGLDPQGRAELERHPDALDDDSLDLAAAEADLALAGAPSRRCRKASAGRSRPVPTSTSARHPGRVSSPPRGRALPWMGWVAAAAAAVL